MPRSPHKSKRSHAFSRGLSILFIFLIQPDSVGGQFGEIASVITGLLGAAGPGAGLAGLGSSAAGLAGAGAAGAQGASAASSALSNFGQLYQLAQAALQLTGTGVGIANQASESAWFPVAVEHAAKMNRDFHDRVFSRPAAGTASIVEAGGSRGRGGFGGHGGLGGLGTLPGFGGLGGTIGGVDNKIGGEYGKNFESEETEVEVSKISFPPWSPQPPFSSSQGRLPGLPGLVSLLPGETSNRPEPGDHHNRSGGTSSVHQGSVGPPFIAPTSTITTTTPYVPPFIGHLEENKATAANSNGEKEKDSKPKMEFSVDADGAGGRGTQSKTEWGSDERSDGDLAELHTSNSEIPVPTPLTAVGESSSREHSRMVPELKKLINVLRASNLSKEEFAEIASQLESNNDLHAARENPVGEETLGATHYKPTPIGEHGTIVNEKRDMAANRNLLALKKAFLSDDERILRKVTGGVVHNSQQRSGMLEGQTQPVVITLRRPNIGRDSSKVRVHAARVFASGENEPPTAREIAPSRQWSARSNISSFLGGNSQAKTTTTKPLIVGDEHSEVRIHPRFVGKTAPSQNSARNAVNKDAVNRRVYSSTNSRVTMTSDGTWPDLNVASNAFSGGTTQPPQAPTYATTQILNKQAYINYQTTQAPDRESVQQYQHHMRYYPYGYPYGYAPPQVTHGQQQQPHPSQLQQQPSLRQGQYLIQTQRSLPARNLPNPQPTTPPTIVHHPLGGHDSLLTLTQPGVLHHQLFG